MREDIPLGIVKGAYKVYQNHQAFEGIDSIREEYGLKYIGGGQIGRGERVYLLAEIPQADFTVVDTHKARILLLNSHDGTLGIKVFPVDSSKYVYAMEGVSIKHSGRMEKKMEEAYSIIQTALLDFSQYRDKLNQLYQTSMSDEDVADFCRDVVFRFSKLDQDENEITAEDLDRLTRGTLRSEKRRFILTVNELLGVVEQTQGEYGQNGYGAFMGVLSYCNGQRYRGTPEKRFDSKFNSILTGKMRKFQAYALPLLMGRVNAQLV
jgi:hypothetical protein